MKNLLLVIFTVFISATSYAQNVPPPSQYRGGPPPPGLPIDQHLIILFFIGVIIAFVYNRKLVK